MAHTKMVMIGKVWCSRALTPRSKTEGRKGRHLSLVEEQNHTGRLLMENTSTKT